MFYTTSRSRRLALYAIHDHVIYDTMTYQTLDKLAALKKRGRFARGSAIAQLEQIARTAAEQYNCEFKPLNNLNKSDYTRAAVDMLEHYAPAIDALAEL
jgi:hypothetical protein